MKAHPVVVRARYALAIRYGMRALAQHYAAHVAPLVNQMIEASKPRRVTLPTGGLTRIMEMGPEYIIPRRRLF